MGKTQVVIDSTAGAPREMLARYTNLHIVPLKVILGERQWPEPELNATDMFAISQDTGYHPKTSQPAPGDFVQVLEPLVLAGDSVIVITMSAGLSGTAQSARAAAQWVGAEDKVFIVDSGTTAMGMIKMAEMALMAAAAGRPPADIVRELTEMVRRTHTVFVPDTLEYLKKGGRIGSAAALVGTVLRIRPVLSLTADGRVVVLDKVRTKSKAVARMVAELKAYPRLAYVGIGHLDAAAEAQAIEQQIREIIPQVSVFTIDLGAVLGAHLGPGLTGIIFQESID